MSVIIKHAITPEEMHEVYKLTHDSYVELGYITPKEDGELRHYPHLDNIPETTVLVALIDGKIVGTNSWTIDGPRGLHVDESYSKDVNKIRQEGRYLGASWRIIVEKNHRRSSEIVRALIKKTVQEMVDAGIETALFSFNAKHAKVYQRYLNMKIVATSDSYVGLNIGPSVLMRLDDNDVPPQFLV